jgi:uncharacterized membrane protein
MDALTDGVFSIVATLLVLDIKVPHLPEGRSPAELEAALLGLLPSLVAFAFSFLTVMIYWVNHDRLGRLAARHDDRTRAFNLVLLFFICLIPFVTAFIAAAPLELSAVVAYGLVMLACAVVALLTYRHLAFGSDLLAAVSLASRRRYGRQVASGPVLYAAAIAVAFLSVKAALGLFLLIPLVYLVAPAMALDPAA